MHVPSIGAYDVSQLYFHPTVAKAGPWYMDKRVFPNGTIVAVGVPAWVPGAPIIPNCTLTTVSVISDTSFSANRLPPFSVGTGH